MHYYLAASRADEKKTETARRARTPDSLHLFDLCGDSRKANREKLQEPAYASLCSFSLCSVTTFFRISTSVFKDFISSAPSAYLRYVEV